MLNKQSLLLLFSLTLSQINAQLKKSFEYKFDESLKNVTLKDYNIYIHNNRGLNSLLNVNLLDDKKINSICVSPLGNQILIVSEKKVSLFNIEEELEEELENKFEFQEQIKKIVLNHEKTSKYLEGKEIKKVIIVPKKIINIVC